MKAWGFSLRFERIVRIHPYGQGTKTTAVLLVDIGITHQKMLMVGISLLSFPCIFFSVFQHCVVFTPEEVNFHDQKMYSML